MAHVPTLHHTADLLRCPVCKKQITGSFTIEADLSLEPNAMAVGEQSSPTSVRVTAKTKFVNLSVSHNCATAPMEEATGKMIDDLMESARR